MTRAAWTTLIVAVVAFGVMIAALAAVLAGGDGSGTTTVSTTTELRGFELPLTKNPSALTLAGHDGDLLVGIAAVPGGRVEIAALRGETPVPTDALRITVGLRRMELDARPCGRGCSRVDTPLLQGGRVRELAVRAPTGQSVSFDLPPTLPPDGEAAFGRALRTMDSLESYRFTERLSSGRATVVTRLEVQAPDRLRLRTRGFASVIVGKTRWDLRDGEWEQSPFPGLDVRDVLMWHEAKNPRIVDQSRNGTRDLVAFGLKPVPAWFRLVVAPSGRVLEAEMTAASHFMLHRYSDFDAGIRIEPPK